MSDQSSQSHLRQANRNLIVADVESLIGLSEVQLEPTLSKFHGVITPSSFEDIDTADLLERLRPEADGASFLARRRFRNKFNQIPKSQLIMAKRLMNGDYNVQLDGSSSTPPLVVGLDPTLMEFWRTRAFFPATA